MNRSRALAVGLLTMAVAACRDTALAPPAANDSPLPQLSVQQAPEGVFAGRVLARLVDGADPTDVAQAHGVAFERAIGGGRISIFRGAAGNERALAARMGGDDRVFYAEPDYLRQPTGIDPRIWSFDNPGELTIKYTRGRKSGTPVASLISVGDADIDDGLGEFDTSSTGPVAIASIDTGVEMSHREFDGGAHMVAGYDYYSDDSDPSDTNDHGTHTTGTMVGNTVGVAGAANVASNVTVYVYRVCGGNGCPTSAIVSAIYDAASKGVVAMNLSLGGSSISQSEEDAIATATAAGSLVIAAAGNGGTGTVSCPACDPNAVSVAATDWMDEHAYYTNWGPGLDISAPGGELYSNTTEEAGIYSSVRGNGYAYFQGTSMATPHVTGAAAVIASLNPAARGETLRALLLCNTDELGATGYDTDFGWGRLSLAKAVNVANQDCLTGGGGTGSEDPIDPPPPSGGFSFAYSIGKVRGYNAVRIDSLAEGYSPGTLEMTRTSNGTQALYVGSFALGTVYQTPDKGGATYTLEVCATSGDCGTATVVY